MISGDIGDAPMLAHLNKPQKRALILRDQLRYLEPAHLDTFLDGISADEPPTYKNINGAIHPPFAQVIIKDGATRFDLGNVLFPEEGQMTYRAYLTVEDDRFEMRTENALPEDDAELSSIAIHRFVAENMFPLFKTKYKAIHARMEKINEARRVAYNMLNHPPARFIDGETLTRLHPTKPKGSGEPSRDGSTRKRKEVVKHTSNKRQRVGLETIPDTVKSETFNTIPTQIKVDLFNSVVKAAFPNFDNLIVASWNVVSVYANVGSDFPELHKAVVELKGALEEFESAYSSPRPKSGSKGRKDTTPAPQIGTNGSRVSTPVPTVTKEVTRTPVPASRSNSITKIQAPEDLETKTPRHQTAGNSPQGQMPPPDALQMSQQHKNEELEGNEPKPEPRTVINADRTGAHPHSTPLNTSEHCIATSTPNLDLSSSNVHDLSLTQERQQKIRERSLGLRGSPTVHTHQAAPGSELMRKRQEYASSITKANRSSSKAALGYHPQDDEADEQFELDQDQHARPYEQRKSTPGNGYTLVPFLGNSVLGTKKSMGNAPVAPMLHTRKDGDGLNGGSGEGRRSC